MLIELFPLVGDFGEDKDVAAILREREIRPAVIRDEAVTLDFGGVTLVTQSFIHALISDILRVSGEKTLELLEFKNCVDLVQGIVSTVVQYSLDTLTDYEAVAVELVRDEAEKQQSFSFMKAARELGCDESEERFVETVKRLAKAGPQHRPTKKKR